MAKIMDWEVTYPIFEEWAAELVQSSVWKNYLAAAKSGKLTDEWQPDERFVANLQTVNDAFANSDTSGAAVLGAAAEFVSARYWGGTVSEETAPMYLGLSKVMMKYTEEAIRRQVNPGCWDEHGNALP